MSARRAIVAIAVVVLVPVAALAATVSRSDRSRAGCEVAGPKAGSAITGTFGAKRAVIVPPEEDDPVPAGTTQGRRQPDGTIYAKILWRRDQRRAGGRLRVTGQRLDGGRSTFRARVDQGQRGFVPSSLVFSDPGCWRVAARAGGTRVRYVVRVIDLTRGG